MALNQSNNTSPADPRNAELPRCLSLANGTNILVGSIIGIGIFLTPNIVALEIPFVGGVLIAWILGGILSLFGALTFAELGAAFPKPGAQFIFLKKAYGPLAAFLYGWTDLTVVSAGSYAGFSVVIRDIMGTLIPMSQWMLQLTPVILILIMLAINYRSAKLAGEVVNIFTYIKIGAVLLMVGVIIAPGVPRMSNLQPFFPEEVSFGFWKQILLATVLVIFSYNGWHRLSYSVGELRNPQRNVILASLIGMAIIIFLYVGTNITAISILSIGTLAQSTNVGADVVSAVFGPVGGTIISIAILISISGVFCTNMLTIPRIFFTMAREKLFFAPVGWTHVKFKTPAVAIFIPATIGIIMSQLASLRAILTYIAIFNWAFLGLTAGAVFILRRKLPNIERPYKTWGYPVVPLLFILGVFLVIGTELLHPSDRTPLSMAGIGIILLGIPVYYLWARKIKEQTS